VGTIVRPYNVN